jgi:hypothetical protein
VSNEWGNESVYALRRCLILTLDSFIESPSSGTGSEEVLTNGRAFSAPNLFVRILLNGGIRRDVCGVVGANALLAKNACSSHYKAYSGICREHQRRAVIRELSIRPGGTQGPVAGL